LERRKRAVRAIFADRLGDAWKKEAMDALLPPSAKDDIFERKGWNKVDSGFRLWGGGRIGMEEGRVSSNEPVDAFLQSHGWNDVDSGFRLI
jgi:hypothetical protein